MAAGLTRVIDIVHSLAKFPDDGGAPDSELLERYLTHQDQVAFRAIVHRHGNMVLSVCKRVLDHHQDAEDALQATFLILAGQARAVRQRSVGGWLHTVAYRTSVAVRSRRNRRARYEKTVPSFPELETSVSDGEEWRHELDLAVKQLPERYRDPIVLCELGNISRRTAARQLGSGGNPVQSELIVAGPCWPSPAPHGLWNQTCGLGPAGLTFR